MKKLAFASPIAAACALAFAPLAQADTTITLDQGKIDLAVYGIADVSVSSSDSGFGYKTRIEGGGVMQASRFGIKASRAFNDGIKVFTTLEAGLQITSGVVGAASPGSGVNDTTPSSGGQPGTGSRLFARQALAGVAGPFGTVSIGRQYSGSYFGAAGLGSAWGDGFYSNPTNILAFIGGMPLRVDNSLLYTTPTIYGAAATVTLISGSQNNVRDPAVVGTTTVTDASGQGWDLFLRYGIGNLRAGVSTWNLNANSYVTTGETALAKKKGWMVVADYDFNFMYVAAMYADGTIKGGNYENITKALSDSHGWYLGARVPFGEDQRHTIMVGYNSLTDESLLHRSAKLYGGAYWYQLEASTRLYASWGQIKNNANASYALVDAGNLVGSISAPGVKATGFEVGMNYNF